MERFSNAKVGDKVYDRRHGNGEISSVNWITIECIFDNVTRRRRYETKSYWRSGKRRLYDVEALLFYRDDTSNYLEERPVPKVPPPEAG